MNKTIHIVCLDCPSPPDYGGAIDMFFKVKTLYETGHNVILHYFDYNSTRKTKEIEPYCTGIYAYKRKAVFRTFPLLRPYIVQSRINKELVDRLNKDQHPVLLEGIHCSGIIPFLNKKERIVLRMHNEEAAYYRNLAKTQRSHLKRTYFLQESRLLHKYQKSLDKEVKLVCLSQTDMASFGEEYGFQYLSFIPCFLPWQEVKSKEGKGEYCLYHGNLAVSENEEAVVWLIKNIFSQLPVPFVIAGKNISKKLFALAKKHPYIMLVNNPPADELRALIRDAQINVLPSMNSTGVKLKVLNALLNGRYCMTNNSGVLGSGMEKGVIIKDSVINWISAIAELMQKEFSVADLEERNQILSLYDNRQNAQKLSELWTHCQ